ncbi:MAG: pirin family protein [Gammaproteobacteria bacterium]|nr:pirin family protein [Gammaproteobacteria bacterium]MCW8988484.1 pirin family protein [Gammaproteobacteria bacterium]
MENNTFIKSVSEMSEGDGVDVHRLFPVSSKMMNFDPFVLWDNFNLGPARGFPTHPHRGFEAITYMFTGSIEHKDNLGNHSTVTSGGAQRFTAGRGLEHSEMPDSQDMSNGIQLWINLAKNKKAIEPDYQQVDKENIPNIDIDGGTIRVIVGEESPVKLHTAVRYLDVHLNADAVLIEKVPDDFRGFIYLLNGQLKVNAETVNEKEAFFFENIEELDIAALSNSHFMLCMGKPHREPIRQYGPFVD